MTTEQATMTTQEVANRFIKLSKEGRYDVIQDELYAEDAVSIEPQNSMAMPHAEGLAAIKLKGQKFNESIEEMHGGWCSEPVVGGAFFSVAMGMDATMKGAGRMKMDEIAVYEVKDGKIIKEQFFF